MKSIDTLQKLQQSSEYRSMYREIIHTQIQTLVDHLALTGVESVLLTTCTYDSDVAEKTFVGTELGQDFQSLENLQSKFKEFCLTKKHVANEKVHVAQSAPIPELTDSKRKFDEISDIATEPSTDVEQTTPTLECKRSRSLTPLIKSVKPEDIQSPTALKSFVNIPKGYSKCSQCNYMSKFKANVTRHERSVHRINLEGATLVTVQYICSLCEYKSTYRANLIRHERSVHKVVSSNAEIESRKIRVVQNGDGSLFMKEVLGLYETETGNQSYTNQSDSEIENIGNQSIKKTGDFNISLVNKQDPDLTNVEMENQTVGSAGNQSYSNENGSNDENFENQSNMEISSDKDVEGCHTCNYCQLIYTSKTELLEHVVSAHPKTSYLEHENTFEVVTGLQTTKQEVCKCGKAFQYRTSLLHHERKCEFLITSQGSKSQEDSPETFRSDSMIFSDPTETNVIVGERDEIDHE